jgi:hypothetical protein
MVPTSISSKSLSPIRTEPLPTLKMGLSRSITYLNKALTKVAKKVAEAARVVISTVAFIILYIGFMAHSGHFSPQRCYSINCSGGLY